MINSNELRIGNYLMELRSNDVFQVEKHFFTLLDLNLAISTPIQLTEQWLLDFGFAKLGQIFILQRKEFKITMFFHDSWHFIYKTKVEKAELIGYWTVHELQNLYFALKKEELTKTNNFNQ